MTRGGSPSSQIDLFATQISEQITRLRALARDEGDGTPSHDVVALKRAVMATRLLAGSARILRLASLQQFLDQLLSWLQTLEGRGHPPTATEMMILESVVDLEESLMDALDATDGNPVDLSPFDDDLAELLAMMARAATAPAEERTSPEVPAPEPEKAETETSASTPLSRRESALTDALGALVSQLEQLGQDAPGALSESTRSILADLAGRLVEVVGSFQTADPAPPDDGSGAASMLVDEDATAGAWPRGDALLDPLADHLRERGRAMGLDAHFMVTGDSSAMAEGVRVVVGQILQHLLDDICDRFQQALHEEEELVASPRVHLEIATNRGRLELVLRDNAPRLDGAAMLDVDHLSFYRGLRRSRAQLQQLGGVIRVEPGSAPDRRFHVILPLGLDRTTYRVVDLGGVSMAVPWVAIDTEIPATSVRMEVDHSGESFEWEGHHVPVVDLGTFLGGVTPPDPGDCRLLLLGSVERRIGLLCASMGEAVEADELLAAPPEFGLVSAGAVPHHEAELPVLDVARVLGLRFRSTGASDLSGALHDPYLDSYIPEPEPAPAPVPAPESAPARAQAKRVLLINQSEFRRRDLARTLEDLGHLVTTARDLDSALDHPESGSFDLVVTDLRLGQQGADRLQSLQEQNPGRAVVLTSAVAREQAQELARTVGASHCWLEPYRRADLVTILRDLP